ncbi:MAG: hypothetical protein Q8N17_09295 [Burkholderiaceae bacterium]|nr:hypothetical protein [Burkholderiaceae bacterium]
MHRWVLSAITARQRICRRSAFGAEPIAPAARTLWAWGHDAFSAINGAQSRDLQLDFGVRKVIVESFTAPPAPPAGKSLP